MEVLHTTTNYKRVDAICKILAQNEVLCQITEDKIAGQVLYNILVEDKNYKPNLPIVDQQIELFPEEAFSHELYSQQEEENDEYEENIRNDTGTYAQKTNSIFIENNSNSKQTYYFFIVISLVTTVILYVLFSIF